MIPYLPLALVLSGWLAWAAVLSVVFLLICWLILFLKNENTEHENTRLAAELMHAAADRRKEDEERRNHSIKIFEALREVGVDSVATNWAIVRILTPESYHWDRELLVRSLTHLIEIQPKSPLPDKLDKAQTARLLQFLTTFFEKMEKGIWTATPRLAKPPVEEIIHRLGFIRELLLEDELAARNPASLSIAPSSILQALEELYLSQNPKPKPTTDNASPASIPSA